LGATAARAKALGLSREEIERLGLEDVDAKGARRRGCAARPGILIPYFDFSGRPLPGVCRIRFGDGEVPKYGQPRGAAPRLYLPPTIEWGRIVREPDHTAKTPRTPVVLVEGEFKSILVSRLGFPCAGLGGVWSWQSKKQGRATIPDLSALEVAGRDVLVAFDSDVVRNPDVSRARDALTDALVNLSARVYWIDVPDLSATSKATGIDDYVMAQGDPRGALAKLIADAIPHAGLGDLLALNRHYLHVQGPKATGVYSERDGRFLTYGVFDRELAGRKVLRRSVRGNLFELPLSHAWLDWTGRRRAKGFCFRPGASAGLTADGHWNTAVPHPAPQRGDVKPFLELVDFLFQHEDAAAKRWFLGWCAHPFKQPGVKLLTAVYLWSSQQGAGKGQLARCLSAAHGDENAATIAFDDLRSDFVSARLVRKTFVAVDEASGGFETREYSGRVKKLITDPTLSVNQKYQPAYEIENAAAWLLTTNHVNSIKIEREARRFLVVEGPRVHPEDRERNQLPLDLVARLNRWLESGAAGPALVAYFKSLRTSFANEAMAPATHGFEALTSTMSSAVDEFARACCTTGVWEGKAIPEVVIADDLVKLYDRRRTGSGLTRQGLGIALSHQGAKHLATARGKLKRIYLPDGRQAIPIVVREWEKWSRATTAQVIAYLTAHVAGGEFVPADPHSEVVRLRAALKAAEERARKAEGAA
jgi:hypothetical protein